MYQWARIYEFIFQTYIYIYAVQIGATVWIDCVDAHSEHRRELDAFTDRDEYF